MGTRSSQTSYSDVISLLSGDLDCDDDLHLCFQKVLMRSAQVVGSRMSCMVSRQIFNVPARSVYRWRNQQ